MPARKNRPNKHRSTDPTVEDLAFAWLKTHVFWHGFDMGELIFFGQTEMALREYLIQHGWLRTTQWSGPSCYLTTKAEQAHGLFLIWESYPDGHLSPGDLFTKNWFGDCL